MTLPDVIQAFGCGQLGVLVAAALVPVRLRWRDELAVLPRLHRQMYLIYGGYVVLSIVALGFLSLRHAAELAAGDPLARSVCAYNAIFWGIRLTLQPVLDARAYLSTWWLRAGYHVLSVLFASFALFYGWLAVRT